MDSGTGVSIVIPNYNYAHFLVDCLESLKLQTFSNWEAFVIDNDSSDDSEAVVKSFGDPRIKFVSFSNGGIIARSRNYGATLANFPYLAFLDSDDMWDPEKLSYQLRDQGREWDLSYHAVQLVGGSSRGFQSWGLGLRPTETLLTRGNPIVTSSVLLRKSLFESASGFPEGREFIAVEDYYLWLRLSQMNAKFLHIPKKLGSYRIHNSASRSSDNSTNIDSVSKVFLAGAPPVVRRQHLGFASYDKGMHFFKQRDLSASLAEFFAAAKRATWRFRWRALVRIVQVWTLLVVQKLAIVTNSGRGHSE